MGRGSNASPDSSGSSRRWSLAEIADKIESEGLGYMVCEYLSADSIADPALAGLWRKAATSMAEIEAYLREQAPDEEQTSAAEPYSGIVKVPHEPVLCDSTPKLFASVTDTDKWGMRLLECETGGKVRLNLEGGRFGSDPEVYIEGDFEADRLNEILLELSPDIATHIPQSLTVVDAKDERHYVRLPVALD